ncbi:phosphatase PAP2 family protein [Pontibacter vulgaris]|uniref:phosphatase PAP2 family protein n=1 Tax=Pontibacter vulgaris TaxID=2905679 RepID=UPI001FA73E32|nr:phosphatase PAP2 family protein [Pontibacter vulgaris]
MKNVTRKLWQLLALLSAELVVVWLVFFGCIMAFSTIVNEVFIEQETDFDQALFAFADSHTSPGITQLMKYISFFASAEYLLVAPAIVVLIFAFFEKMHWFGLKVLLISFSGSILNQALKRIFDRPRPDTAMEELASLSFPSGHAMIGGIFYGLLIYIVWQTVANQTLRWIYTLVLTLLILLIGYSRIYLNVHYATDVLAGYSVGALWLIISIYLMRKLEIAYLRRYETKTPSEEL